MATARVMETWAHGQDVADALGVDPHADRTAAPRRAPRRAHPRLRLRRQPGRFRRRPSSAWNSPAPTARSGPGDPRTRGNGSPAPRSTSACSSPRRRHRDDLALVAEGPDVEHWLTIAQAFAGPPGGGREPGSERVTIRIGNCSGFYGDRFDAMREMLTGGELDVLTGDYLAELTMLILGRDRMKDPTARLRQDVPAPGARSASALALDTRRQDRRQRRRPRPGRPGRRRLRDLAERLGLDARIAHVEGDDLVLARRRTRPRHAADRQRLPRRVGHRRVPERAAPTSWSPAGSPTPSLVVGAGRRPLRLGARRLRRARRRGRRRARHRVRRPGHRRQLPALHRDRRPAPPRVPDRGDPRRRLAA